MSADSNSIPSNPTITAATRMAGQKPMMPLNWYIRYAPSMKNAPWEKLITPMSPRMMFRPKATRMYNIPSVTPLTS